VGQQTHHTDDALRLRARVLGSDQVDMAGTMFDAGVTFADIEWLRAFWRGPLVVKGIQTLADAHAVIDRGADGSCSPTTAAGSSTGRSRCFNYLPQVVAERSDRAELLIDSGSAAPTSSPRSPWVPRACWWAVCLPLRSDGRRGAPE